MKFDEFDRNF
jgi:hypothetical protein